MLHKIGTTAELPTMASRLPGTIYTDLCTEINFLDAEYGSNRDYLQTGGYAVILETADDLTAFSHIVNYESHPCEWAVEIGEPPAYITATYVLSNDFAITLYLPRDITPNTILNELE